MRRIILTLLLVWACIRPLEMELSAADATLTNLWGLNVQVSDFRMFHSSPAELEARITAGKALLDVRGILHLKGGVIPESTSYTVNGQSNLEEFLKLSGIELEKVTGVQLRLIKRDLVIQTPRFYRQRDPKQYRLMKEMVVEPGDIVLITGQEL